MARNRDAGGNFVTITFRDMNGVLASITKTKKAAEKAIQQTFKDVRREATKIVADAISTEYTIKKTEITGGKAVKVRTEGTSIESMKLKFQGRVLTPLHFKGFGPKKPPELTDKVRTIPGQKIQFAQSGSSPVASVRTRKPYKIRIEIKKGQKKQLKGNYSTPPFMAPAAKGSGTNIPFQRSPGGKWAVNAIKTLSVPQMITSDDVSKIIQRTLNAEISRGISKEFDRQMNRN